MSSNNIGLLCYCYYLLNLAASEIPTCVFCCRQPGVLTCQLHRAISQRKMRVLELFSGIGGVHYALEGIDIGVCSLISLKKLD